jgi:hypothetical protein
MDFPVNSTATIITTDYAQIQSFKRETLATALAKTLDLAISEGYTTFLLPSTGISSWIAHQIINNSHLTLVWCIVYYYQRMLWENSEDIGALELTQKAHHVLDLNFEETDHDFKIYPWFIERSRYIIFITDGSYPSIISSLIGYAQVLQRDGVIFNCQTGQFSSLKTHQMIPLMSQDE